jgi:hypothetical protein
VHSSNFKNPLDSKNQFGFSTISPDRLLLLNKQIEKPQAIIQRKPKLSPSIQMNGMKINATQRVANFDKSKPV